jgi:rhodanese-related sulfurtransferase
VEINQTTPQAAHAAITADREAVYLDVRTEEEFTAGHPAEAINVPVAFPNPSGGMLLNPDFQRVVESLLPRDKPIFCGCQSGGRSQTAAEILAETGYTDVKNVRGGFGGVRDPSGLLLVPGWIDSDLPISTEVDEDDTYAGLKQRAGL